MSLGVNLLMVLTERVARRWGPEYDIEILEMHHKHKVDAPSGTALGLGEAAARGRGVELANVAARGRDGLTGARKPGAIGFAALRGGDVVGDHHVIFAGEGERLELAHKGSSRKHLFARRRARGAVAQGPEAGPLRHGRRAGAQGLRPATARPGFMIAKASRVKSPLLRGREWEQTPGTADHDQCKKVSCRPRESGDPSLQRRMFAAKNERRPDASAPRWNFATFPGVGMGPRFRGDDKEF